MGLGIVPKAYDPLIDLMDLRQLHAHFARLRASIGHAVKAMPGHTDYIARHVAAEPMPASAGGSSETRASTVCR